MATAEDLLPPETRLAVSYAPRGSRAAIAALFALDATLGNIVRTARDPLLGQMRLAWWHEALSGLGAGAVPPQPLLTTIAGLNGLNGPQLAEMVDGWEMLVAIEAPDDIALRRYAACRGGALFRAAMLVLRESMAADTGARLGADWALADLARHSSDRVLAARALALIDGSVAVGRDRALRPLTALALLARRDARHGLAGLEAVGSPLRVARLAWHGITGR